jgi:hypothetical protein
MKALSKRTKILAAIIGGVIVVVAIVLVLFQPSLDALLGTAVSVKTVSITPANPTITYPGLQVQLTSNYNNCTWSVSDAKVLVIRSTSGYNATIEGAGPGKADVIATCTTRIGNGTTTLSGKTNVTVGSYPFGM